MTLYWTNRPGGDSAREAEGSVCSADQADQVSSGSPTLPVRTWTPIAVPAGQIGPPGEGAEAAQELGVVDLRDQLALGDESGGEPNDRAGVAGPQENSPGRLGQEREDLAMVELRQRGALAPSVADLVELAVGSGADQQAIARPAEREDEGLGPEDLAGDAVVVDPVDGVVARRDRLGRGGAATGAWKRADAGPETEAAGSLTYQRTTGMARGLTRLRLLACLEKRGPRVRLAPPPPASTAVPA